MPGDKNIEVSVIVITKDEEVSIAKTIKAAKSALKGYKHEIIIVDSCSSDNTVTIAKKSPVKIIQLNKNYIGPGAGAYVGVKEAKGKYIMVMDGHMYIHKDWFKKSIPYISKKGYHKVGGYWGTIIRGEKIISKRKKHHEAATKKKKEIWGGDALYEADMIKKHNYHPFLPRAIDIELAARLASKGFKSIKIDAQSVIHDDTQEKSPDFIKKNLDTAISQGFMLKTGIKLTKLLKIPTWITTNVLSALEIITLASVVGIFYGIFKPLCITIALWLILGILSSLKYKSLRNGFYTLFLMAIRPPYYIWGILKPLKSGDKYPKNYKILKS